MSLNRKIRIKAYVLTLTASAAVVAYPLSGAMRHAFSGLLPHYGA